MYSSHAHSQSPLTIKETGTYVGPSEGGAGLVAREFTTRLHIDYP